MKVAVHPADLGGCGHYRLIWPAQVLRSAGHDVDLVMPGRDDNDPDAVKWTCVYQDDRDGRPHLVDMVPPDADVVVLQRPLRRLSVEAIGVLQAKGIVVVVEIDDDFSAIHPKNPAWRDSHPAHDPDRNWNWLARACALADLVTVSTPALARRYGSHGRVAVLPNYVPERYLYQRRHTGALSVLWSGNVSNHPADLQVAGTGVAQAVTATGAELRVVGSGDNVCHRLGVETGRACGWVALEDYPTMMAMATVGIVPLELTAFNEAKSWLKGLELAACGVPFVASPTGPYRALAARGVGLLADKPKDWRRLLIQLLRDVDAREAMGERQRAQVARSFLIEDHAERWWDAWRQAADVRARVGAA